MWSRIGFRGRRGVMRQSERPRTRRLAWPQRPSDRSSVVGRPCPDGREATAMPRSDTVRRRMSCGPQVFAPILLLLLPGSWSRDGTGKPPAAPAARLGRSPPPPSSPTSRDGKRPTANSPRRGPRLSSVAVAHLPFPFLSALAQKMYGTPSNFSNQSAGYCDKPMLW